MNEFAIEYITLSNSGNYLFHNRGVTIKNRDISNKQLIKYYEYLKNQIKLCSKAIIEFDVQEFEEK